MSDLSINEIAERAACAILEERYINKDSIVARLKPILKIWLKKADATKKYKGRNTTLSKLQATIEEEKSEKTFWKNKVKEIDGNNMTKHYESFKLEFS